MTLWRRCAKPEIIVHAIFFTKTSHDYSLGAFINKIWGHSQRGRYIMLLHSAVVSGKTHHVYYACVIFAVFILMSNGILRLNANGSR